MTQVAVGLPVYNAERYLEQALESLVNQTHRDLEIVISDNGSTDRTSEICERYAAQDPRITYYRHDSNRGAGWNFNFVLDHANAPYFRWYAYDDCLDARCIELCADALDADASLILVWPRTIVIDENGTVSEENSNTLWWDAGTPSSRVNSLLGRPLVESLLRLCHPIYGLMRREVLMRARRHGSYPSADCALLVELAVLGPWARVPEAVFYSRRHLESSTVNKTPEQIAAWFDPRRSAAKAVMPITKLFCGYVLAVLTRGVPLRERMRCMREVLVWVSKERQWRVIYSEYKLRAKQILGQVVVHRLGIRRS